jgi:hypothetical protein
LDSKQFTSFTKRKRDGEQKRMRRRRIKIREEFTVKKKKYSAPSSSKRDCYLAIPCDRELQFTAPTTS